MVIIRTILAQAIGLALTAIMALIVFPARCFGIERQVIEWWAATICRVCLERLLSVRIETSIHLGPARKKHLVVIGNHPSFLGAVPYYRLLTTLVTREILLVAKREHRWNPFIGLPLLAMGTAIFIDRGNAEATAVSIRDALSRRHDARTAILIFPDKSRPTRHRIENDRAHFGPKIPGIESWLQHTLVPRTGGLRTILDTLGKDTSIVNTTVAFSTVDEGIRDAHCLNNATFHFHVEEQEPPVDLAKLSQWLNSEWEAKNERISRWRRPPTGSL